MQDDLVLLLCYSFALYTWIGFNVIGVLLLMKSDVMFGEKRTSIPMCFWPFTYPTLAFYHFKHMHEQLAEGKKKTENE